MKITVHFTEKDVNLKNDKYFFVFLQFYPKCMASSSECHGFYIYVLLLLRDSENKSGQEYYLNGCS